MQNICVTTRIEADSGPRIAHWRLTVDSFSAEVDGNVNLFAAWCFQIVHVYSQAKHGTSSGPHSTRCITIQPSEEVTVN